MAEMQSQMGQGVIWLFYIPSIFEHFVDVSLLLKGGDQQKKMQEQQQAMEDMMNGVLSQVLSQEARARCKFIHQQFTNSKCWKYIMIFQWTL
jgi:hypothetical protein